MKLLVASEFAPNAPGGGPAVVRQMLKGWPTEDLFWWSCFADSTNAPHQRVAIHQRATLPAKLYPARRFPALRSWILERLWTPWAAKQFRASLDELRPDAIWIIPHNWSIPPLSSVLLRASEAFHATVQDYVDVHTNPARFGSERCRRMAAEADALYKRACTRDATSHPMIGDLELRTGAKAAQMLHAGLEAEDFSYLKTKPSRLKGGPLRIAYAGTILVEPVFELFIEAINQLRARLPREIELHLYGANSYRDRAWYRPQWMREHGNLSEGALLGELRASDWGFSPMALEERDPRYNRFSFPTKFITCLSAGLPMITLGHCESSVMKMASKYQVGITSSTRTAAKLAEELCPALSEIDPWQRYGSEILRCAHNEFDAARMRRTLFECFARCAEKNQGAHPA